MEFANISIEDYDKAKVYYGLSNLPKQDTGRWLKIHDANTQGNLVNFTGGNVPHILALTKLSIEGKFKDFHLKDTDIQIIITAPNENFILSNTLKHLYIFRPFKTNDKNEILEQEEEVLYTIDNMGTRIILNEDSKSDLEARIELYDERIKKIDEWNKEQVASTADKKWMGYIRPININLTENYYNLTMGKIRRLNHGEERWVNFNYDLLTQPTLWKELFRNHPLYSPELEIIDARGVKIKNWEPAGNHLTTTGDIGLVKVNKNYEVVAKFKKCHHINLVIKCKSGVKYHLTSVGVEGYKINIKEIMAEINEEIDSVENAYPHLSHQTSALDAQDLQFMFDLGYDADNGILVSEVSPAFYYDETLSLNKNKENCVPLEYFKIGIFTATAFDKTMSGAYAIGRGGHSELGGGDFRNRGLKFAELMENNKAVWASPDYHQCMLYRMMLQIVIGCIIPNHPLIRYPMANHIVGLSLNLSDKIGYVGQYTSGTETVMSSVFLGIENPLLYRDYCYQIQRGQYTLFGSDFSMLSSCPGAAGGWGDGSRLSLLNNPDYSEEEVS